jgi:hypothetical protein
MSSFFNRLIGVVVSLVSANAATSAPYERVVTIGTDVATFLIFHPDDLAHRSADPIAWYAYGFAYRRESEAGRLVGFGTGGDGGYAIRLTTGALTAAERPHAGPRWDYPLIVRHGRVYLDNSDGLPGEEKMDDPSAFPDRWFALPNGPYRVTVQALLRSQQAETRALPDYVVSFQPVGDIATVPIASNLPDLRQVPNWQAAPSPSQDNGYGLWPKADTSVRHAKALTVAPDAPVLPGTPFKLDIPEADYDRYEAEMSSHRLLRLGPDGPAALAKLDGRSRWPGRKATLRFSVLVPAAIAAGATDGEADFRPIAKPAMAVDAAILSSFKSRLRQVLERSANPPPAFERERFEALAEPEALTSWALRHLPLDAKQRLEWYGRDASTRISLMTEAMSRTSP